MKKQGMEVKQTSSIRLEPRAKHIIIALYGSLQKFIDIVVGKEIKNFEKKALNDDE
jgi:hypothetical protein